MLKLTKSAFICTLFILCFSFNAKAQVDPLTVVNNTTCSYKLYMGISDACDPNCSITPHCIPPNSTITIYGCQNGNPNYHWDHGEIYLSRSSSCTDLCQGGSSVISNGLCGTQYNAHLDACAQCGAATARFQSSTEIVIDP